ncbi:MAG: MaoC/PaaZ C-terminal domain-containing protein [Ketobacteraceae bacterium]|nr:MaoC/PaaZ C-terminal domain-containing protein [Ketobacteraceae bacterium]
MSTTIELDNAPSTLSLYARAVTGRKSGNSDQSIPKLSVVLNQVVANGKSLAQYREVCGFPKSGSMPSTYPHILAFPLHMELLVSDSFPFPLLGLVHVKNEITQYRAIGNLEPLDLECVLGEPRTTAKGKEFDITTYAHVGSQLVWESVSTMLYRCKTDIEEDRKKPQPLPQMSCQESWPVPENIGRRYAKVSGDRNPIHLHALTAKAFGFPRAIAHGMWTKAHSLASLESKLPKASFKVSVQFKLPIFLPNNVIFEYDELENGMNFMVKDKNGEKPHLSGTIETL